MGIPEMGNIGVIAPVLYGLAAGFAVIVSLIVWLEHRPNPSIVKRIDVDRKKNTETGGNRKYVEVSMVFGWLKKRNERKLLEARTRGFAWAMTAYFIEKKPLDEIEAFVAGTPYPPSMLFDYAPSRSEKYFDAGANKALRIIEEYIDGTQSEQILPKNQRTPKSPGPE